MTVCFRFQMSVVWSAKSKKKIRLPTFYMVIPFLYCISINIFKFLVDYLHAIHTYIYITYIIYFHCIQCYLHYICIFVLHAGSVAYVTSLFLAPNSER